MLNSSSIQTLLSVSESHRFSAYALADSSLNDIIRTRPSVRLIGSGNLLFIDGRQPICFIKNCLNQSSIPLGSKISDPLDRFETRRHFADGLPPFQKWQRCIKVVRRIRNGFGKYLSGLHRRSGITPCPEDILFTCQAYHVPCALSRKDKYATLYSVGSLLGAVVSVGMVSDGFFNPCTVPLAAVSVISPLMF